MTISVLVLCVPLVCFVCMCMGLVFPQCHRPWFFFFFQAEYLIALEITK